MYLQLNAEFLLCGKDSEQFTYTNILFGGAHLLKNKTKQPNTGINGKAAETEETKTTP